MLPTGVNVTAAAAGVCARSVIWLSVMARLASTISISTSLLAESLVMVTLFDAVLILLKGRSTPTLGNASETPPKPELDEVLVSPPTAIPSISVCISSIAACTLALVVLPVAANGTSVAV